MDKITKLRDFHDKFGGSIVTTGFLLIISGSFSTPLGFNFIYSVVFCLLGGMLVTYGFMGFLLYPAMYKSQKYSPVSSRDFRLEYTPANRLNILYRVRGKLYKKGKIDFLLEHMSPFSTFYEQIKLTGVDNVLVKKFPEGSINGIMIVEESGKPKIIFYTLKEIMFYEMEPSEGSSSVL